MLIYGAEVISGMKNEFVESTVVMVAVAVVLSALLAAGGLVAPSLGQGYVPVRTSAQGVSSDAGAVSLSVGGAPAQAQVARTTANIVFGIAG
jgi:hypothetical protein